MRTGDSAGVTDVSSQRDQAIKIPFSLFQRLNTPFLPFSPEVFADVTFQEPLCILLAIAALRWLQCIQWMKRCSAEGEQPDQKV